jgi:cellulose synthase/poly-beta-1,6-N-acetylglucosamine synthase-like glycosyltransferase
MIIATTKIDHKTVQQLFVSLFVIILILLNVLVGVFLVHWRSVVSMVQFLILQSINIGVAFGLTELVLSLLLCADDLPHLEAPAECPAVAVLYVTCDDLIPEALESLRDLHYPNYHVYVLDDSELSSYQTQVDTSGFTVVRRGTRLGYKAGNLNNWLVLYGKYYDYFVVADSDSILPQDFIERMLAYAQHPANRHVAIFQSKILLWNRSSRFARTLGGWMTLWLYPIGKLGNLCETMLSWGHNCLYRTAAILDIGGFDARFVAEDYATGIALLRRGYKIRLVDVTSYEAMPETAAAYTGRAVRWARQTLQLFELNGQGIPLTTRLHIIMNAWSFAIWILYVPGMLLALWGTRSSLDDVWRLITLLTSNKLCNSRTLWPFLIVAFYNVYFLLLRYPLARKLGISTREYFATLIALLALGPYMAFPLIVGQLKALFSPHSTRFVVTSKSEDSVSVYAWFWEMKWVFLLVGVVLLGLLRNPLSMVFNAAWLVPILFSPFVLWWLRDGSTTRYRQQERSFTYRKRYSCETDANCIVIDPAPN